MTENKYGIILVNLDKMIEKSGLSKNKVAFRAEIQRTQLNNYCKGKIQRIDLDVLARLCSVIVPPVIFWNLKAQTMIKPPENRAAFVYDMDSFMYQPYMI